MTAQYTKIGNTVGWFDKTTNTWLGSPAIEIYLVDFIGALPYALQDELGEYFLAKPIVKEFLSSGKLTKNNIFSMKNRLENDFTDSIISVELKAAIEAALDGVIARG